MEKKCVYAGRDSMINLKKTKLPETVKVDGSFFKIHTDFRFILIFIELGKNRSANLEEFDFIYVNEKPRDRKAGYNAICQFISPPHTLPRSKEKAGETVLDYDIDAPYIYAAFMERYGIDLVEESLHWHKFTALLQGLHDTQLNQIINARLYKPTGKNSEYDKAQLQMYEAWRLPQPGEDEPDTELVDFLDKL